MYSGSFYQDTRKKMYGKIVNVPNSDNFLLQHLKMSRNKAQNAIWRNNKTKEDFSP